MAVTFDFGTCPACGENNSKTLQACRACHAMLPWAKTSKNAPLPVQNRPGAATNAIRPGAAQSQLSAPQSGVSQSGGWQPGDAQPKAKFSLGDIAFAAIAVQILGGIVFVAGVFLWFGNVLGFYPTFPLAGYLTATIGGVIWRAGLAMD